MVTELIKQRDKLVRVPREVENEARFKELTTGLSQVRLVKGGKILECVDTWKNALAKMQLYPGASLELYSLASVMDEVVGHTAAIKNNSTGAERQHCFAFAQDPTALRVFKHLTPMHDGRGVVFCSSDKSVQGDVLDLIEIDSFVFNTDYLFALETKSTVTMDVIDGYTEDGKRHKGLLERLQFLQDQVFKPRVFSKPGGSAAKLRKYHLVPVLTGKMWMPGTEKHAHSKGIITVSPDGEGGTYTAKMPPLVHFRNVRREWAEARL